ncbi:MAG: transposase [Sutterella wadsworthensis]|nr:transposase [Sutterella wadsworthensis]
MPKTLHLVKKPESIDEIRALIELTNTTFQNRTLVNLAIVFTCLLLIEVDTCFWSNSYCAISVGDGRSIESIKKYIEGQKLPS